jgi:hypothetical protein
VRCHIRQSFGSRGGRIIVKRLMPAVSAKTRDPIGGSGFIIDNKDTSHREFFEQLIELYL